VVELGMNHPGEIARLAAIAAADRRHGQQRPARAPGIHAHRGSGGAGERRVLAALPADGVAVYPGDDTYTPLWQGWPRTAAASPSAWTPATSRCSYTRTAIRQQFESNVADGKGSEFRRPAGGGGPAQCAQCARRDRLRAGRRHRPGRHRARAGSFAPVSGRLQRKRAATAARW
jgi:UDP-N-acetylmuramoyl-tripeptide--D-alanyl-D-alanine ligase